MPSWSKNKYFIIAIALIVIAGGAFTYYVISRTRESAGNENNTASTNIPGKPNVTFEIQKTGNASFLIVHWSNLPGGTNRIEIYRAKAGTAEWNLWTSFDTNTAATPETNAENGSISIPLTQVDSGDYVYYLQAVASSSNSTSTGGGSFVQILWTSSSTTPTITTSTPTSTPQAGNQTPPPPQSPPSPYPVANNK